MSNKEVINKVVLITGAARRIGAETVRALHKKGMNIVLHYRNSAAEAKALQQELNSLRKDSIYTIQADLHDTEKFNDLISETEGVWGRLDALVNNASSFFPTKLGDITEEQWEDLLSSNLKAPFFLSQAAAEALKKTNGCIVNITDIHASKPLKDYPVYCIAKAGLLMMTKSLAKELGPDIRVNAVAPGAIMWPEDASELNDEIKEKIISRTTLKRSGEPSDVAKAVLYFVKDATFVTGQIISVDGGR